MCRMYGIFAYMCHKAMAMVGKLLICTYIICTSINIIYSPMFQFTPGERCWNSPIWSSATSFDDQVTKQTEIDKMMVETLASWCWTSWCNRIITGAGDSPNVPQSFLGILMVPQSPPPVTPSPWTPPLQNPMVWRNAGVFSAFFGSVFLSSFLSSCRRNQTTVFC